MQLIVFTMVILGERLPFHERPEVVDGYMALPDKPGLGLELREESLEKYGVKIG